MFRLSIYLDFRQSNPSPNISTDRQINPCLLIKFFAKRKNRGTRLPGKNRRLKRGIKEMNNVERQEALEGIAIIGMAGRFPGARNIENFWRNLKDGVESISFFSEQ